MIRDVIDQPPLWRVLLGLVVAPGIAALVVAAITPAYSGLESYVERVWRTALLFWLVGGVPAAVVIGLPAYLALRRRMRPSPFNCVIVGGAVAALPWMILTALSAPDSAYSGGDWTVIDGRYTLHGWIENAKSIGAIALAGGLGGLTFWFIVRRRKTRQLP